jgi:hypothetical protein
MKKGQNLKTILIAEGVLVLCLCIAVVGIVIYASGPQDIPASGNPPAEAPTATAIPANVPTTEAATSEAMAVETPITETPAIAPPAEVKGMALEKLPDKTTKFTDYDGGYEVTFPVGWLAVRPGDDEFDAVLANEGTKNAALAEQMNIDKSGYVAEFDRLFSYPLRPDIQKNVIFGFSKTHFDSMDALPIDKNSMGNFVRSFEASNVVPGLRVTGSNIVENRNGISIMVVKGRFSLKLDSGDLVPFSVTVFFFKPTSGSLVTLTFSILQDYQEQISPDLYAIQESIKVLGQ